MSFPKIGNLAPDFKLPNQMGKPVKLSQYRNDKAVVLYFYPKAMTPGCTVQATGIRDSSKWIKKNKVVILAVSPDSSERLARFDDKENLKFTLLSDGDHAIAEKYGAWGLKKFMGREYMGILRTTFIIGMDGRLKHVMSKVKTKTHHDDIKALLDDIDL
mgnify:CR=1 FL=1